MIWVEMVTLRHMGTMGVVRTPPASPSTLPSKMPSQVTDSCLLYQDMHGVRYRARDITALFIAALSCHTSASCSAAVAKNVLFALQSFAGFAAVKLVAMLTHGKSC